MELVRYLRDHESTLAPYVRQGFEWSASDLVRFTIREALQTPALQQCSPRSVLMSLMVAAQLGLDPSGAKGEGYLVPFRGECSFMPGYRGLLKLVRESGLRVVAHIVYEGDTFSCGLGTDEYVRHSPTLSDRGAVVGAYAVAREGDGAIFDITLMTADELERVREDAKSRNRGKESPAWARWPEEMYRKTILRRICKTLPLGTPAARAVILDNAVSSGQSLRDVALDVLPDESHATPPPGPLPVESDLAEAIASAPTVDELQTLAGRVKGSGDEALREAYKLRRVELLREKHEGAA